MIVAAAAVVTGRTGLLASAAASLGFHAGVYVCLALVLVGTASSPGDGAKLSRGRGSCGRGDGGGGLLGDFHQLSSGKWAARVRQCFSETREGCSGDWVHSGGTWDEIPDIVRNGFNFTDGAGTISRGLMCDVARRLEFDPVPSALQIRIGGNKGEVVVDPRLEGRLDGVPALGVASRLELGQGRAFPQERELRIRTAVRVERRGSL